MIQCPRQNIDREYFDNKIRLSLFLLQILDSVGTNHHMHLVLISWLGHSPNCFPVASKRFILEQLLTKHLSRADFRSVIEEAGSSSFVGNLGHSRSFLKPLLKTSAYA